MLQDLDILEGVAEPVEISNWQIEWRVKGSEVTSILPKSFLESFIPQLSLNTLQDFKESTIEPTAEVCVNLSHLVINKCAEASHDIEYEGDHTAKKPESYYVVKEQGKNLIQCEILYKANLDCQLGSFGILILQIPVVGGFRGGDFRVKTRNNLSEHFITSRNSHRSFYATVIYDDTVVVMDPVTRGSRLSLVFNLVHKASIIGVTRHLYEDCNSFVYKIWQFSRLSPKAHLTKKQQIFRDLLIGWNKSAYNRGKVFAIPLLHTYSKKDLCFATLKGSDRSTAQLILSLLKDFVEVHMATVTKYVGYKDADWNEKDKWATSGSEIMSRRTNGKRPDEILENEWTDILASNWSDAENHRLLLPPLPLFIPDQLMGLGDVVFNSPTSQHNGKFNGLEFDRAAIILWPRDKLFSTALCFGLDQALDVAESGLEVDTDHSIHDTRTKQMRLMLALCKKEPNRSWFASVMDCSDLRCDQARPVSLQVASKRALRLMNLCINWELFDFSKELLNLLFSTFERTDYRCRSCSESGIQDLFVGGICSYEVADKLVDLFIFICANPEDIIESILGAIQSMKRFDLKQTRFLAHFAICLFHRKCFEAAMFVCEEAYNLTLEYLQKLTETQITDGVVGSCIDMLLTIDGVPFSEESRILHLLDQLKKLSLKNPTLIIGWLQNADPNLFKSASFFWEFYMKLIEELERQLVDGTYNSRTSPLQLEKASAQLISAYLRIEDPEKLQSLVGRIIDSKNGRLLAAAISSWELWAVSSSPSAENTFANLRAARVRQLVSFKSPMFKWEQPDAVLPEHPKVEAFLRSTKESMEYNAFVDEEAALSFSFKFFDRPNIEMGYSARVTEITPVLDNDEYPVAVLIIKTPDIYDSALKHLRKLENWKTPDINPRHTPRLTPHLTPRSPAGSKTVEVTTPLQGTSTPKGREAGRKSSTRSQPATSKKTPSAPPEKRSKRLSAMAQKTDFDESSSTTIAAPMI